MHDKNFDEQKGSMKDFGGKVQEAAGDLTDNERLSAEGHKNQAEGKAQNVFGKVKNAVGDAVDNVKDALDPNNKDPMHDDQTRRSNM